MSMMGELKFFLGFQVEQMKEATFICQTKYMKDMLKKFDMADAKPIKTPMALMVILISMKKRSRLIKRYIAT
jgi:hypothetical protein